MKTSEQINKTVKQIKVGDTFVWRDHRVIVTDTCIDEDNGREVATIEPTEKYGFPIDIYLDKYGLELVK